MNVRVLAVALLTGTTLLAQTAAASILVVGQDRRVSASAFVAGGVEFDDEQFQEIAPDAGPFDAALAAAATVDDGNAQASGSQISVITPTFIRAEGNVSAASEIFEGALKAYAASQSNVAIRFMLTQSATFTVTGFLTGADGGVVSLQLSRPFETVAFHSATNETINLNASGTLAADTYDLNVTCTAAGNAFDVGEPGSGTGTYEVLFALGGATDAPVIAAPTATVLAAPNPFRDDLRLTVPDGVNELRILDARGRVVRTLTGSEHLLFDGRDAAGRSLASGVYWVKPIGVEGLEAVKVVRVQ
jgi:hypothetical protein